LQHQAAAAFLSQHFSQALATQQQQQQQQQSFSSQLQQVAAQAVAAQQQQQSSVPGSVAVTSSGHQLSHHQLTSSSVQSQTAISGVHHQTSSHISGQSTGGHLSMSSNSSPTGSGASDGIVTHQGSPPQAATNGLSNAATFLDLSPAAAAAAAQFATNSGFVSVCGIGVCTTTRITIENCRIVS